MEPQAKIDRSTLLVDKHTEYIKSFTKLWETTDKIEFVATGEGIQLSCMEDWDTGSIRGAVMHATLLRLLLPKLCIRYIASYKMYIPSSKNLRRALLAQWNVLGPHCP